MVANPVRPSRLFLGLATSVSLFVAGCHRDHPVSAATEASKAWLSEARPEASGAIGYLQPETEAFADSYPMAVLDARSGQKKRVDAERLMAAPFVPAVGEGGEVPAIAVFAQEGARYLLSSKQGWVWYTIKGPYRYTAYEECLDELVKQEEEDDTHAMQDGWWMHTGWVLNLSPQPLREAPSDAARQIPRSIGDAYSYLDGTWPDLKDDQAPWDPPVLTVEHLKINATERGSGSLVRILQRKGDWVQVALPREDRKVYSTQNAMGDSVGLMVAWDPRETGWARWRRPGRRKGTTELLFSASYWGFGD